MLVVVNNFCIKLKRNYKKRVQKHILKNKHEDKDFSSHQGVWKNFEQNNESIALIVLFASQNREEITVVCKSEHTYNRENNALLLMISDDDKK